MPTDCLTISYNGPRTALPSLMRENTFKPRHAIQYAEPSSLNNSPQPPLRATAPWRSP